MFDVVTQDMAQRFYEKMMVGFPPKSEEERMIVFVKEYEKLQKKHGYTIHCCGDAPACGSIVRVNEKGGATYAKTKKVCIDN